MGRHVRLLFSLAILLSLLACGMWVWRARSVPPVPVDDAPERSLEEIEASESASQAFQEGLAHEADENWKKIHWSSSLDAALKTARDVSKPVLILLSVREIGTQDPGRC